MPGSPVWSVAEGEELPPSPLSLSAPPKSCVDEEEESAAVLLVLRLGFLLEDTLRGAVVFRAGLTSCTAPDSAGRKAVTGLCGDMG